MTPMPEPSTPQDAEKLRVVVGALNEFRDGLTEALNAHGVPAMPSWREAIDWLAAHGGDRSMLEDARWLARLVYEFLLIGPSHRTGLTGAETDRFLDVSRRLAEEEKADA